MLTRLYVDNYKSLVNFDLRLGKQHLFMGKNGTGKTTVFEVLAALQDIADGMPLDEGIPPSTMTRWQGRKVQLFEVEASIEQQTYRYVMHLNRNFLGEAAVTKEELSANNVSLFSRREDEVRFHETPLSPEKTVIVESHKAALSVLPERLVPVDVTIFRTWMKFVKVVRLDPRQMSSMSEKEESRLAGDMSNFASWFRHMAQEKLGQVTALNQAIQAVLDGFESLSLTSSGAGNRSLQSNWRLNENGATRTVSYNFEELSEGQRALIGLYSLLYFAPDGATLCFDEPDNFVALREIQPWLLALRDRENIQSLLISHHPEVINLLAPDSGLIFERVAGGPVRVEPFRAPPDAALSPAELVARGWENGR